MAEIWIDTRLGELLVGEAAISQRLEQTGPGDIAPLRDILLAREFKIAGDFEKADVTDWQKDDYINFGKWVFNVLNKDEEPAVAVSWTHVERLYSLGLGPSGYRIHRSPHFQGMKGFREAIGSPITYREQRSVYRETWGAQDYEKYIEDQEIALDRKLTRDEINALARQNKGPHSQTIVSNYGLLRDIDTNRGYYRSEGMTEDNLLEWGVDVMRANNGLLHWTMPYILSRRRQGIPARTIHDKVGGFGKFRRRTQELYADIAQVDIVENARVLEGYRKGISNGEMPAELAALSGPELMMRGSIFALSADMLDGLSDEQKQELAVLPPSELSNFIRSYKRRLTEEDVDLRATELALTERIWPERNPLYVSHEEIDEEKARHSARRVATAKRRKALASAALSAS